MFNTSQSSHTPAAMPGRKRTTVLRRLMAVTAVGLLGLTACSTADGAGEPSDSSSTDGTAESSEAQASASPDTGVITEGAADEAWKDQARKVASKRSGVDAATCVDGLLDQQTLDGIATALPEVGEMSLNGLFTYAGCAFTATELQDEDLLQAAAEVEIRRYYLATDEEYNRALDESGYLKHNQCADDVETDENGVSTVTKHGVKANPIPGGIAAVDLQAAWHCFDDGATTSAVLIHAAEGQEDGFSDTTVLTNPDLAIEIATRLSGAESDWAPQLDELYEKNFKDNMGQ